MVPNRFILVLSAYHLRQWWAGIWSRYGVRLQLTIWYGATLVVLLVMLSLFVYWLLSTNLHREAESQLKARTEQIASTLNIDHENSSGQAGLNFQDNQVSGEFVLIYSDKGALIEGARALGRQAHSLSNIPNWARTSSIEGAFNTITLPDGQWLLYARPISDAEQSAGVGWLIVGHPLEPIYNLLNQTVYALALTGPLVILFSCIGGYFMAGKALAPVAAITRTARRIQAEGLGSGHVNRVGMEGRYDELGELASTFDAMLAHLEESFQRERRFTADAAHELRTPLAVMQAETSLALSKPRPVAEYKRVLAIVESEIARMGRLVGDLLTLARADEGQYQLSHEQVNLTSLCQMVACKLSGIALAKGVTLTADLEEGINILGDTIWLEQMLLNLLDNGIKYTKTGGRVRLSLTRSAKQIEISVEDNGIGISADQLPHIFNRFYRGDKSRSRDSESPGIGLGLAISEWVAKSHGGCIQVSSEMGIGSRFVVHLPVP